jgi:hypothetical protein
MPRIGSLNVAEQTTPKHAGARPRAPRLRTLILFGAVLLVLAIAAGLALMLPARSAMLEGRDAIRAGRDALLEGDAGRAREAFARGETAFEEAEGRLGNPLTRLASLVPVVGRTPDAVTAAAEAGVLVTRAGRVISGAVEELPGGAAALAPREGMIPLDPFRALAPPLAEARDLIARAQAHLRQAPRMLVPAVVAEPVETFASRVAEARRALVAAEAIVRALPEFLGGDGRARYFLGAQNPAELRGTGGLIGAYAILTVVDGRIEIGKFLDILDLERADPETIEPPNPDYARIYEAYGSAGEWSNINMTPDAPSAATAIERLYETVEGDRLDGTILADPVALSLLSRAAGPVRVPGTATTLDPERIVPFLTNEAYSLFPDAPTRKRILGAVAGEVFVRFLSGAAVDPAAAGRALVEAGADGHLILHSADDEVQVALEAADVAGSLAGSGGDYLGVVVNNAGGNKIDFYAERTVRYEVELRADGSALGLAEATFLNGAPSSGQPVYVIGPHPFTDARAGESLMLVSTYCAPGCQLHDFRRDGAEDGLAQEEELDHPLFLTGARVPSGESTELAYEWTVPDAWAGDEYGGAYRLTVRGQPTLRPSTLEVIVRIPAGMRIVGTSPGMRIEDAAATWTGTIEDRLTFEVKFARKLFGVF